VDAKRGQVFLVAGNQATDLSAFGSGMNRFFTDHLAFEILRHFPNVDTDNHFNGVGLHGVFDSKFDRVIISKLDYIPLSKDIKYDPETKEFYIEEEIDCIPITTTTTSTTAPPCKCYKIEIPNDPHDIDYVDCNSNSITIYLEAGINYVCAKPNSVVDPINQAIITEVGDCIGGSCVTTCSCYSITNNTANPRIYGYTDCITLKAVPSSLLNPGDTIKLCAVTDSVRAFSLTLVLSGTCNDRINCPIP
jgi:hypothetical protein